MSAVASQFAGFSIVCSSYVQAQSEENSKLRVTGLCEGNPPGTSGFPHKWPVTRKMFPFDDVIMISATTSSCNVYVGTFDACL